jgi:signal transduction histidine kinase
VLQTGFTPQSLLVQADLALIDRVMQNLVDNAIKFTPARGKVQINAVQQNGAVRIEVINTGKGISEGDQKRIFDRYFKGSLPSKAGSGLGLAIVRNILELHQSLIQVKSQPDQNTVFYFSLPLHCR